MAPPHIPTLLAREFSRPTHPHPSPPLPHLPPTPQSPTPTSHFPPPRCYAAFPLRCAASPTWARPCPRLAHGLRYSSSLSNVQYVLPRRCSGGGYARARCTRSIAVDIQLHFDGINVSRNNTAVDRSNNAQPHSARAGHSAHYHVPPIVPKDSNMRWRHVDKV